MTDPIKELQDAIRAIPEAKNEISSIIKGVGSLYRWAIKFGSINDVIKEAIKPIRQEIDEIKREFVENLAKNEMLSHTDNITETVDVIMNDPEEKRERCEVATEVVEIRSVIRDHTLDDIKSVRQTLTSQCLPFSSVPDEELSQCFL